MITCLRFVFFGRRQSKERGQYVGKFLEKKLMRSENHQFHKTHISSPESFFNELSNKTMKSIIGLLFFLILPQFIPCIRGYKFFTYFDLHTHCTPLTFFIEKSQTLFFLIEHEKL